MLKTKDLRAMSVEELSEKLEKTKKELMTLRFQAKTGKLERQSSIRENRQDAARILTIMNEKKVEVNS